VTPRLVLKAALTVGATALFFAVSGLFNALAGPKIGGVSLAVLTLGLMGLWVGFVTVRAFQEDLNPTALVNRAVHGVLAGGSAGLIVAAFELLISRVDVRFVLDSVTPETAELLRFGQNLSTGIVLLVGGWAALAGAVTLAYPLIAPARSALQNQFPGSAAARSRLTSGPAVRYASLALLGALVVLGPLRIGGYYNHVLGSFGIYVMMGLGLNVVVGFAGLLDLGYVAFFAIGAYAYAFLNSPKYNLHVNFWIALPIVVAVAAIGGVLLGIPVLRMRGDYLAIVTLGFGEIIRLFLNNLVDLTGGPQGILGIRPPTLPGIEFSDPLHFYYLILLGCVVTAFVTNRLDHSRIGRAWVAIREDEDVARAMGIDTVKYKLLAFAIGASFAGIGGALFSSRQAAIFPADFTLMVSINVLCLIIIGGMGSIPGVIAGSVALIGLPELLREFSDYRLLIFGALLVIMMVFRPEGLIPSVRRSREIREMQEEVEPEPVVSMA